MRINLYKQVELDIETIVKMFVDNGWTQVDDAYIEKNCGIEIHPDATRESIKTKLTICFSPELLYYYDVHLSSQYDLKESKKVTELTITPWIYCSFLIHNDESTKYLNDNLLLYSVIDWVKNEISQLPIKPFYDEDAFFGNFKRPKKDGEFIKTGFYLNPSYPNGYWDNHVI